MEYKRLDEKDKKKYEMGFYEWLEIKKKFTSSVISLITNESMFDISGGSTQQYKQLVILNRKDLHRRRIVEIMMKEDFIFIESNPDDLKIISSLSRGSGIITSSPIHGVGVWNDAPYSASSNSSMSSDAAYSLESKIKSINVNAKIDAALAVDTETNTSQEHKASILANEVYGFDAKTMHELKNKISRSKPIKIKTK